MSKFNLSRKDLTKTTEVSIGSTTNQASTAAAHVSRNNSASVISQSHGYVPSDLTLGEEVIAVDDGNETFFDALDEPNKSTPSLRRTAVKDSALIQVPDKPPAPELTELVDKLTDEQLTEYLECFTMFDGDGSGTIDYEELGRILMSMGQNMSGNELQAMLDRVDANVSGDVDFSEFCAFMAWQMHAHGEDQQLRHIFECLDETGKGAVPKAHFRYVIAHLCPILSTEEVDDMLACMSGDSLSFKQFYNIFQETFPNVVDANDIQSAAETELVFVKNSQEAGIA